MDQLDGSRRAVTPPDVLNFLNISNVDEEPLGGLQVYILFCIINSLSRLNYLSDQSASVCCLGCSGGHYPGEHYSLWSRLLL